MNKRPITIIATVCFSALMIVAIGLTGCGRGSSTTPSPSPSPTPSVSPQAGQFQRGGGMLLGFLALPSDMLNSSLDAAVSDGTLTQDQANEVRQWWQKKPEMPGQQPFTRTFPTGTPVMPSRIPGMTNLPRQNTVALSILGISLDELDSSLQTATQAGTLTEQQAGQVRQWWRQKPSFLNETVFSRTAPEGLPPFTRQAP